MRRLARPDMDTKTVYESCVSEVLDPALNTRLTDAKTVLLDIGSQYISRAPLNELHLSDASKWGKEDQIVVAGLTKKELTGLYSTHMVKSEDMARTFYDKLMLAPQSRCPYCGFGQVSTLDHFLPKSYYPAFSVLPANLVPSCKDCNTGKGSGKLTANNQVAHPYFESDQIEKELWLHVVVHHTSPASVEYIIRTPLDWPPDLAARVINHFRDLDLASRYGVQAGREVISIASYLDKLTTPDSVRKHLRITSEVEMELHKNSWEAALYAGLAASDWYCDGGWRLLEPQT